MAGTFRTLPITVLSDVNESENNAGLVPASFKNLAKVFLKLNSPFGPLYDLRTIVRIGRYRIMS